MTLQARVLFITLSAVVGACTAAACGLASAGHWLQLLITVPAASIGAYWIGFASGRQHVEYRHAGAGEDAGETRPGAHADIARVPELN